MGNTRENGIYRGEGEQKGDQRKGKKRELVGVLQNRHGVEKISASQGLLREFTSIVYANALSISRQKKGKSFGYHKAKARSKFRLVKLRIAEGTKVEKKARKGGNSEKGWKVRSQ